MNDQPDNALLRSSRQLYTWLLGAYPKRHREEYGPAMQQAFRDQCRDAWREARGWGVARLWLRVLPDLLKTSFVERLSTIQGDSMTHRFARILGFESNPRVLFLRTALTVFAVVFGATAITAFLPPKRFTSEAQLLVRLAVDNPRGVPGAGKTPSDEAFAKADQIMAGEVRLIQSDTVLGRVIKTQNLETRWAKASGQRMTPEEAVGLLRSRLKVRVPPRSRFLQLRVNSEDADEATQLAQAVMDAYLAVVIAAAQDRRHDSLDRAAMAEERRKEKERFRDIHDIVNLRTVQSPTPGEWRVRPNVPGCLLMGGAGGLFLALTVGVAVTLLAKRRVPEKPEDSPSASASIAA